MTEYIAHASIDENGKIAGGKAGDQTGKEICIRTWYDKTWGYVLHIEDELVRRQFANNMIDVAKNDCIGYNQNTRNTLLTQAKKVKFDFTKISTACECDCSSLVTIALLGAIYTVLGEEAYAVAYSVLIVSGNCATTSTLRSRMKKLTMISVTVYSSTSYTRSTSNAVYGDIYLKEGSHVVAYIESGEKKEANKSGENENKVNGYTGNSIVDYLTSIGKASDFSSRKVYAENYGIENYSGTAEQNIALLKAMRNDESTVYTVEYYKQYTGTSRSIVDALISIGEDSSKENRKKIANANGIENYSGTSSENIKMMNLLKEGKLKKYQ